MAAPQANRAEMAAVLHRYDQTLGSSLVFSIGGLSFLVGILLLSIALRRARVVPMWVAVGMPLGGVLNIVGFSAASTGVLILSPPSCSARWAGSAGGSWRSPDLIAPASRGGTRSLKPERTPWRGHRRRA